MLILARKLDQEIEIQAPDMTTIIVRVTEINGGAVRLGFAAPPSVRILRRELLEDRTEQKGPLRRS